MPVRPANGQTPPPAIGGPSWFATGAGRALLESEQGVVSRAVAERPGLPWLWLRPVPPDAIPDGRGLVLARAARGWTGAVTCDLPLPLPGECFGSVVLQHVAGPAMPGLLEEAARILVPGGRLWLLALNPLSPYRWRWRAQGLAAYEPLTWRRQLRATGLQPDAVSQGLGPTWRVDRAARGQDGPGLRAGYLIRSEKRSWPVTPVRTRRPLRLSDGLAAG